MPIARLQTRFGRIFTQRCFLLFAALIALILVAPFVGDTVRGRFILNGAQALVLIAAVAAVGRTTMPFGIALLLGIPAFVFLLLSEFQPEESSHYLALANAFFLAFYIVAVSYLLRYVFNPEVMTEDKLFGAAAGYLMLGIMWAYAYHLLQFFEPQSFVKAGDAQRSFFDLLYMSFGCLTSNGPGDLTPIGKARSFVMVEQVCGTLFIAILVARLAGIYTPSRPGDK
jgi:cytosine/uracil/thiamine/allantoin permease